MPKKYIRLHDVRCSGEAVIGNDEHSGVGSKTGLLQRIETGVPGTTEVEDQPL